MRKAPVILLGILFLLPAWVHADDEDLSPQEIKTLFFGKDNRVAVSNPQDAPWAAIGQLETASGNLCTATLIADNIALTAGHCLLMPLMASVTKPLHYVLSLPKVSGDMRFTTLKAVSIARWAINSSPMAMAG